MKKGGFLVSVCIRLIRKIRRSKKENLQSVHVRCSVLDNVGKAEKGRQAKTKVIDFNRGCVITSEHIIGEKRHVSDGEQREIMEKQKS